MRRRDSRLSSGAAIWPLAAHAQQPAKVGASGISTMERVMLPSGGFAPFYDNYRRKPFLEGLREGVGRGQNVTIERRFAAGQGESAPALAATCPLNVDVMLAGPPRQPGCARARPAGSPS